VSTAVVTGAGRGFGRAIAEALSVAGHDVVGVSRTAADLAALADALPSFVPVVADATDGEVVRRLLQEHQPEVLVLGAGAVPQMAPVHEQTWHSFSRPWETDTRHVFEWVGAALRQPLGPGSVVVAVSSGAALRGSPLSGGYAAAKAGVRFITSYAAGESQALGLGLRFVTVFPQLTPLAAVGAAGAKAYAAREGLTVEAFSERFQPLLTPALVGQAVLEVLRGSGNQELSLDGTGLHPLP